MNKGLQKLLDYAHNWELKGYFKIPYYELHFSSIEKCNCNCDCHSPPGIKHPDADEGGVQTVCKHCSK